MHMMGNEQNAAVSYGAKPLVELRPLMRMVYTWMGLGLLTTAAISFLVASNVSLVMTIANAWLILLLVQLGLVFGLSMGINRLSPTVAAGMFFVYAGTMGLTLGVMFFGLVFEIDPLTGELVTNGFGVAAIAKAFLTTAGLFGAMTVVGYTTKVDLSKYSAFFMMALIGLVIAMVVNMFAQSGPLDFAISVFGVLLFTALTAWDTQKIKQMAMNPELEGDQNLMMRLSIMGALTLYLDFINMFIFLLRIFAGGRD